MSRVKSPIVKTKGRKFKLKNGIRLPKLNIDVYSSIFKFNRSISTNQKKIVKGKRAKRMAVKSPSIRRNMKSLVSEPKGRRIMSQTRCADSSFESTSPQIKLYQNLLSEEEESKWKTINNTMVFSMNQKVQDAKQSRFGGFCSPGKLMQKITDVRTKNFTSMMSF